MPAGTSIILCEISSDLNRIRRRIDVDKGGWKRLAWIDALLDDSAIGRCDCHAFGLRRRLIDQSGAPKGKLARGEHKSIQTDRVVLVPGPPAESETVRWMYRAFVEEGRAEREIADLLNAGGIVTDLGRPWTRGTVHQVLINEKYAGDNVWNRVSFKLKKKRVRNSPDMWIRADGVFARIVDRKLFETAQAIIAQPSPTCQSQRGNGQGSLAMPAS